MGCVGIFTGHCGENSSASSKEGLGVNCDVELNGNTDLESCIQGNDGARIYGIKLTGSPGIYDYVLEVDARGPEGFGSGSLHTRYTDQTGDKYYLYIYSSTRSTHTLRYNSQKPIIMKIEWSNSAF